MDNQIYYIKKYLKCKVCDGVGVTPFTEFKGHTVGGTKCLHCEGGYKPVYIEEFVPYPGC